MIDRQSIADIIATYKKHGWTLRRVLLSGLTAKNLSGTDIFGDVAPQGSVVDAMWFSRRARKGVETWELRAMSLSPFALLENVADETAPGHVEELLRAAEERLAETIIKPSSAHRS